MRSRYGDYPVDLLRQLLTFQELTKLFLQLVLQTGPDAHRWFTILQEPGDSAGMVGVTGYDFEAIEKVGSFGGYAPGRAALLHSPLTTGVAAPLVRQVLARL